MKQKLVDYYVCMDNPEDYSIWGWAGEASASNYFSSLAFSFRKCNKPGNCKSGALKTDEEIEEWKKDIDYI